MNSTELRLGQAIPYYEPYRLDYDCLEQPTRFEIEFIVPEGIRCQYRVAFDAEKVVSEELSFYPKGQPARFFERHYGKSM